MATNFKISIRRDNNRLHVKLNGHFDGSSAYELIHFLQKHCRKSCRVYIDMGGLRQIHPYGRDILQKNLNLFMGRGINISFTGESARQMA